ncbi:hypothetical protein GCM10023093_31920 [Nemorincola caseinilytica]|uniref:EGF-like domain-containing protein n=1 Tax=Nemorincola caseinilytica TaxID=2054315 RepID=A0ABP8NS59_9BACT
MKFWKPLLLTTALFAAVISTSVLTSCEPNSCDGIVCYNAGSCGNGACTCPSAYEGVRCETEKRNRYLGIYGGFTQCDNTAQVIDTVTIVPANRGLLSVDVYVQSLLPKVLRGFVESNESTYRIVVTNNDSTKPNTIEYQRVFEITLQSDKTLVLHNYEYEITNNVDTFQHACHFIGPKTKLPIP